MRTVASAPAPPGGHTQGRQWRAPRHAASHPRPAPPGAHLLDDALRIGRGGLRHPEPPTQHGSSAARVPATSPARLISTGLPPSALRMRIDAGELPDRRRFIGKRRRRASARCSCRPANSRGSCGPVNASLSRHSLGAALGAHIARRGGGAGAWCEASGTAPRLSRAVPLPGNRARLTAPVLVACTSGAAGPGLPRARGKVWCQPRPARPAAWLC